MDRYTISPTAQAIIDDYRTTHNVQPTDVVLPDSNLVVDDHLQVDNSWQVVVLKAGQDGSLDCLMIEWDNLVIPDFDLVAYISDRKGPNGQTMPIYDEQEQAQEEQQQQASTSASAGRPDKRVKTRSLLDALRDALKRLPQDEQKRAREILRERGVLQQGDDRSDDDKPRDARGDARDDRPDVRNGLNATPTQDGSIAHAPVIDSGDGHGTKHNTRKGMHRIANIDESRTDYWVTYNQGLASTEDQYLPVEERRNRIEVIVGSNIRRGDDVMYLGKIPLRVIGPGPGATSICVYNPNIWGDEIVQLSLEQLEDLTDRAPLDTAEEPMPIFDDALLEVHRRRKQGKAGQPPPARNHQDRLFEFSARQPPHAREQLEGLAMRRDDPRDSRDAYTTLHEGTRQRPPTKSGPGNIDPQNPSSVDHLPQPGVQPDGELHEDLQSKNLEQERTRKLAEHEVQNEASRKPERSKR